MTTYRSPGGPPYAPDSPSRCRRSRDPVSTPAGIFTSIDFSCSMRPAPRQSSQGEVITWPTPRQVLHVRETEKNPCWNRTCPAPSHVRQVSGLVPGAAPEPLHFLHVSSFG